MITLTDEQATIVEAPLAPVSVIACAGSGKTTTAVHRLVAMRQLLADPRSRIALLSFSNIAVDAFRSRYTDLTKTMRLGLKSDRIEIDTLDGFITRHILRPHAHRTMHSSRSAFLVTPGSKWLASYSVRGGSYPIDITTVQVRFNNGTFHFVHLWRGRQLQLDSTNALRAVHSLGRLGGYTHDLGRYWCYRTFAEQPHVLRALVRRYPHIIIDEAQDITSTHQAIIEQLIQRGCQVSLIGDPNQAIYEFADANGDFLREHGESGYAQQFELTMNRRSAPEIVDVANTLSGRKDRSFHPARSGRGLFYLVYSDLSDAISTFVSSIERRNLNTAASAVLMRQRDPVEESNGQTWKKVRRPVKDLARASIMRDRNADYEAAFKLVVDGIVKLLKDPEKDLSIRIAREPRTPCIRELRRLLWSFTRDSASGLPSGRLNAASEWHPTMVTRVKQLMDKIEALSCWSRADSLGQRLAKDGLVRSPLVPVEHGTIQRPAIRVDTVHGAKGESLDAVLYVTTTSSAREFFKGTSSEDGRIAYVALTRARHLFCIAVPQGYYSKMADSLHRFGFTSLTEEPGVKRSQLAV